MKTKDKLEDIAKRVRRTILTISYQAGVGHVGSAFSIVEILVALYFKILLIDPKRPKFRARDRFILSKGHAAPALYAVLYQSGFINRKILSTYCQNGGLLEEHPRYTVSGVEVSTGSLGHGLSIGVGMAMAAKIQKKSFRIFVLISDAECDEGETWEAALCAAHHKLTNLYVILDYNKVQALGNVDQVLNLEPLKDKWKSFGWTVCEVDGHNINKIIDAINEASSSQGPKMVIAHTIRGKGVSFMEHKIEWHYLHPSKNHYQEAMRELG